MLLLLLLETETCGAPSWEAAELKQSASWLALSSQGQLLGRES